jgi:hypothetical protein
MSKCKRCGAPSSRQASAGTFKFEHQTSGPQPQNTGASSIDHDVDIVIGRDSRMRLGEMQRRQDYKHRVIEAEGLESGERLSRLDNGDYFVMTERERKAAKWGRLINQEFMHRDKEFRDRKRKADSDKAAS